MVKRLACESSMGTLLKVVNVVLLVIVFIGLIVMSATGYPAWYIIATVASEFVFFILLYTIADIANHVEAIYNMLYDDAKDANEEDVKSDKKQEVAE